MNDMLEIQYVDHLYRLLKLKALEARRRGKSDRANAFEDAAEYADQLKKTPHQIPEMAGKIKKAIDKQISTNR